jgi:hypothetical protein
VIQAAGGADVCGFAWIYVWVSHPQESSLLGARSTIGHPSSAAVDGSGRLEPAGELLELAGK